MAFSLKLLSKKKKNMGSMKLAGWSKDNARDPCEFFNKLDKIKELHILWH